MIRDDPGDEELGPLSRDVLAVLIEHTAETEGLTRQEAIDVITAANASSDDRFWGGDEPPTLETEIENVLDGLLNRGYLYEVAGELRVTERDIFE